MSASLMSLRRLFARGILVAAIGVAVGCGNPTYAERTDDLNKQFQLGGRSRALMLARGGHVDARNCTDMWINSGASDHHEHSRASEWSLTDREKGASGLTYSDLRKQYFVNGCLDQDRGTAVTVASPPSPSGTRQ